MKLKLQIDWDTDGEQVDLPREVVIDWHEDVTEDNSSDIADFLSDTYGYCVNSFDYYTLP